MIPDPYAPGSGDPSYQVSEYRLALRYKTATNRLDGEAVITAEATEPLDEFSLDLIGLKASRVSVAGAGRANFKQGARKLVVRPGRIAAGQRFEVTVRYGGSPAPRNSRWGQIGWEELDDGILVASQPVGAPTWFPCNDRPADKARYRLEITTEDPYTVVGTGVPGPRSRRSGRTTWTFTQDAPAATYLMAVQLGRYRTTPLELGVPASVHYPADHAAAVRADLAGLPAMMALFSDRFGPYPFARYDVVVTADALEIPLEAQGMAVFGRNHLDGHGASERLVAHELAHQWFGNSVGLARWADIWRSEGFCCYAEWLWSEASGGLTAHHQAKRHWAALAGLGQDLPLADPGPDRMFDDRVYKRGALTLHALRRTVGDEAFFAILRGWTAANRHATGTTAQFTALAEQVSGRPLGSLFTAWLERTALPKLPKRG